EGAATPAVVYSNSNGAWSQTGYTDGAAYTVSASKPGYTITPSVQTITGSSNVVDFTATPDSYPSIVSAISDKPVIQCGESGLYGGGVANVGTVTLTVETSGLNDGTVVGAYFVTSQKADVQVSAANHQRTIAYGRVNDNEAIIEVNPSQLRPGRYEFMVMIPGLSIPAYVPMTLLRSDSSLVPSITDITLSTESMSNKDAGVVTVNIQTENVPDYYNTYVWKQSLAKFLPVPYDTVCNVALLKHDGSSVVNTDWIFKDNMASIAFNVHDLPAGSYRFKVMFNTKTHVGYPVRDDPYADMLYTPLVAYKDFTVYDAETSNDITGFAVPGQTGASVIDSANHTVSFSMPYGSDVTALRPDITINGASVSSASGADVDFSSPVTCTVTAQNGI
ncbi:MAG: hypothetical protein PHU31_09050, partial [Anaerotignum sp.]|nr:hypothetical protein [Anaerotignum sp.]